MRPHVLGIDDAPFVKGQTEEVPIVGVMMEEATIVEGVAFGRFPVDGEGATEYLAAWAGGHRWAASLQGVVLGGITLAGLGIVDLRTLAARLGCPVLAVTRRPTRQSTLGEALRAAGYPERLALVERTPPARRIAEGLYVAAAGATLGKARVPEPLRIAHLIGAALVLGTSRGRV
jgi:endonuclease V-like protein UPF0215 family